MIIVKIETTAPPASGPVMRASSGPWDIDVSGLSPHGDGLLAVHDGVVKGAYHVVGHQAGPDGRVSLDLVESSRLAFLIGRTPPAGWHSPAGDAQLVDAGRLEPTRIDEVAVGRARKHGRPRVAGERRWG